MKTIHEYDGSQPISVVRIINIWTHSWIDVKYLAFLGKCVMPKECE